MNDMPGLFQIQHYSHTPLYNAKVKGDSVTSRYRNIQVPLDEASETPFT